MSPGAEGANWWGRHSIEEHHHSYWQIGALRLWVERLPQQWRMIWGHENGTATNALEEFGRSSALPEMPVPGLEEMRFAFRGSQNDLLFSPALADRPVVTRLQTPLSILPGEEITLYVSTPLWLRVECDGPTKWIRDFATNRLSDTWFGPYTGGELCYASRTPAFVTLRDVVFRLNRVTTAVSIRNNLNSPLPIDRLNLPLPRLSLFYSPRNGFWTDSVTLNKRDEEEMADLRLEKQPPPEASPTQFIAYPRVRSDDPNLVVRAFSVIFKERDWLP